jgi:hypothetical protein
MNFVFTRPQKFVAELKSDNADGRSRTDDQALHKDEWKIRTSDITSCP